MEISQIVVASQLEVLDAAFKKAKYMWQNPSWEITGWNETRDATNSVFISVENLIVAAGSVQARVGLCGNEEQVTALSILGKLASMFTQ